MTPTALAAPRPGARRDSGDTGVLLAALGVAVALRAMTTAGFVAVLVLAVARSGWRPARPSAPALTWGLLGAAVLVAGPLGRGLPLASGRGAFLPWAAAVALVVAAEEAFLRGALWRACERWGGRAAALAVTTGAFSLVHLPLYGWRALPLDLLVGLVLGGLRLASGSVAAPAVAHLLADWAGWWLA